MLKRVLCVDDETKLLQALERQFHNQFDLETAIGPEVGLKAIADHGPFAVVVSDLRMPGMDGIEFLSRVKDLAPDTVRIILTGDADLNAAITALNDGKVFQFLLKPCPADRLSRALEAALEQHRLVTAERELLGRTLRGSVEILIEMLSLVNPAAFSRAHRIRRYVRHIAEHLGLRDQWQFELAAMFSQMGCIVAPPEVIHKVHLQQPLSAEEEQILASQDAVGRKLLAKIPRLEKIAQMVADQKSPWAATADRPPAVRIGAGLLKVANAFDEQMMQDKSALAALAHMCGCDEYNLDFVKALASLHGEEAKSEIWLVSVAQLEPRMIINEDLYSKNGVLLLAKGHEVTESAIARLDSYASLFGVVEPISVLVSGEFLRMPSAIELAGFGAAMQRSL